MVKHDATISLLCDDLERVVIGADSISRSQLLLKLPSLPQEISVPFSNEDVAIWDTFIRNQGPVNRFVHCVAALKVQISSCAVT